MDKKRMILNIYIDNEVSIFDELMPEELKKHFSKMSVAVNTLTQLTNHRDFNEITCNYVVDENNSNKYKMLFVFSGENICINITVPLKKETLPLKEDLCYLRDSFLHLYIKENNTVYIIESKPKNLTTTTIKLYNTKGLIKEFLINSNVINAQKLYAFFREEKKLINNYFKYSNVVSYEDLDNAHIIELRDILKDIKYVGVKDFVDSTTKTVETNEVEKDVEVKDYNLNELDQLLYETGLISINDIKDELKKRDDKKTTIKKEEEIKQ